MTSLTIPDSVETIGAEAFLGCDGLTNVEFGKGLTTIGTDAFAGCGKLTALTLPNRLVTVGAGAFRDCVGLTSLTIPDSVTTIEPAAFNNCSGLISLTIGRGVLDIGNTAFQDCRLLTEIHFNATAANDLDSLTNYTFADAGKDGAGITVTFGANVTRVPDNLFCPYSFSSEDHVPNIVSVVFEKGSVLREIGGSTFTYCRGLTEITFPDGLTVIGGQAFEYTGLTSIQLPDSVLEIGAYCFQNCTELTEADLGNGIRYIGSFAFRDCVNLKSCSLGESLERFGDQSFDGCTGLTSIEIPASLTEYSGDPFDDCTNLETVYVSSSVLAEQMSASWGGGHLVEYADTLMIDQSIDLPPDYTIVDYLYTYETVYNGKHYLVWTQIPLEEAHEHSFFDTWRSDEGTHWHSCKRCAEKQSEAAHEYDDNCDGECNICGYAREIPHVFDLDCDQQCNVCGANYTEAIARLEPPETEAPISDGASDAENDGSPLIPIVIAAAVILLAVGAVVVVVVLRRKKKTENTEKTEG